MAANGRNKSNPWRLTWRHKTVTLKFRGAGGCYSSCIWGLINLSIYCIHTARNHVNNCQDHDKVGEGMAKSDFVWCNCSVVGCWRRSFHFCWGCSYLFVVAEAYNYQNTNMEAQSLLTNMQLQKPMSARKSLKNLPDRPCTFGPWLQLSCRKPEAVGGRKSTWLPRKREQPLILLQPATNSGTDGRAYFESIFFFKWNGGTGGMSSVFMCCLEGVT